MSIVEQDGRWHYRFQIDGRRIQQSTGLVATERNRKKAERMEAMHHQAILEGRWGIRRLEVRSFSDAVKEFLHDEQVNRADAASTYRRIKTSIASLTAFFGDQAVSMMQSGEVERYKIWRLAGDPPQVAPVEPVTVKHDLDNLSLFFQWACKRNYCRENPTRDVERPSDKDAIRMNILSDEDERRYFACVKGNLHDVGRLILLQGMRPAEVLALRKDDIDLEVNTIRVRKGKTTAARRTLRMTGESRAILGRRMASAGPWIFPSEKRPGNAISKLNCPHDRALVKLCRCACGKSRADHEAGKGCGNYRHFSGLEFVLYDLRHRADFPVMPNFSADPAPAAL
jgi:integrase